MGHQHERTEDVTLFRTGTFTKCDELHVTS